MMLVQLKGPPKITLNIQGCLAVIGSPPGAAESAYMGGGPPCKDTSAQFCNVMVTVASKRGRGAPGGATARQEHAAPPGMSKPANTKAVRSPASSAEVNHTLHEAALEAQAGCGQTAAGEAGDQPGEGGAE